MASRSWNRVELIGNLTRDPELRYTPSGAAVATFSVATNRTFVTDGEKREEVDFHRAVAWNKLAELCSQLLKKGNRVFISGRLQNRSWEQEGQNRQITEIVIEDMILLTARATSGEGTEEEIPTRVEPTPKVTPKEESTEEIAETPESTKSEKSASNDEKVEDLDDLPF